MTTLEKTQAPIERKLAAKPSLWDSVNKPTLAMLAVTVAVAAVFSATTSSFLTFTNLSNLATQIAPVLIIAVAMTFVITAGQIDLSVGAIVAFHYHHLGLTLSHYDARGHLIVARRDLMCG